MIMQRIFLTLISLGPVLAIAAPDPIIRLLYNTNELPILQTQPYEADSKVIPTLSIDQARSLATDLNASLKEDTPTDTVYRAKQLANVGILQTYAGDLSEGDQSLRAALASLNKSQGLFDPQLTPLLTAIGINSFLREDFETAEDHFRWSQNIQHRSHGLFSPEQAPNLNWLSRVYLKTDNATAADTAQRYVLRIAEQNFPAASLTLSDVRVAIAAYLGQRGKTISPFADDLNRLLRQTLFTESLELLDQAILTITKAEGAYAPELIDALETKARVHSWRGGDRRRQEQALEQILTIVQNQADPSAAELSEAWRALADTYILTGNKKAISAYRAAWLATHPTPAIAAITAPVAVGDAPTKPVLEEQPAAVTTATEPMLLWPDSYQPLFFDPVTQPDASAPDNGYAVDLRFTVSTQGRAKRVKVLSKTVPSQEVRLARTIVINSRYRPALRNGIVEEVEITTRQAFIPRPTQEDAPSSDKPRLKTATSKLEGPSSRAEDPTNPDDPSG